MVWEINLVHGLLLASQGIIASLLAMLLGRLARWDRQRVALAQSLRPTEQETLLMEFCETASIGICSVASNGRIQWASHAELLITGYSHQEYVGRHITEFHVSPTAISEILRRLQAAEEFQGYESQIRCRNGNIKQVIIDTTLCRRDGEVVGTRFFLRDITERRNSEAKRRELHSRHESLINCSSSGIIELDANGHCIFVNHKWCDLAGITPLEASGTGWKQAIHPEDRENIVRLLKDALKSRQEFQIDCRLQTPRGVATWIHGSAVPMSNESGEVTGFLGSIADITALKQAESLINLAKNDAESANRTKSEFLANMSHEMRTPLNGIIGMTELARDVATDPDQVECLETVKESAEILLTLTNELLDFAKIEAGRISLEHVEFDISDWMHNNLKPLEFRGLQKGLDFRCLIDSSIPRTLVGDPEWLRHILINLVSNAVKFTDKGYIQVSVDMDEPQRMESQIWGDGSNIGAHPAAGPSASVIGLQVITLHFMVEDTGIGIPKNQHQSIFVPFEQADKTITRRYGGTGLGLSIARQLAELMQGKVWLESTVGEGTTFHFTVCLHCPRAQPKFQIPVNKESEISICRVPQRQRLFNVLVVEDNHINQRLIVKILQQRGHKTSVANNGMEALEILDGNECYDVVLMDMHMPRLSGLETASEIRKREAKSGQHLPIVALTADVLKGEREKCLSNGFDGYLMKPINREELFETLLTVVSDTIPTIPPDLVHSSPDFIDLDEPVNIHRSGSQSAQEFEAVLAQDTHIAKQSSRSHAAIDQAQLPPTTEDSAIDQRALWTRLEGDGELLRELLDGYRDYCPQVLAELRQGVEKQDPTMVQFSAHQIKGVVGNFAASKAYATARDLERSGRNSDLTQASDMLAKLEAALIAVDQELESMTELVNAPRSKKVLHAQAELDVSAKS